MDSERAARRLGTGLIGGRARIPLVTAQILDGKATAAAIRADLTDARRATWRSAASTRVSAPCSSATTPAASRTSPASTATAPRSGSRRIREHLRPTSTQDDLEAAIAELNADPACTGYIVQLPLPGHLDTQRALELVDPSKDADGLHPTNLGRLVLMMTAPLPCTPRGIVELLRRYDVPLDGAEVVRRRSRRHRRPAARACC